MDAGTLELVELDTHEIHDAECANQYCQGNDPARWLMVCNLHCGRQVVTGDNCRAWLLSMNKRQWRCSNCGNTAYGKHPDICTFVAI